MYKTSVRTPQTRARSISSATSLALLFGTSLASPAFAQLVSDEVIVTAQKREQSAQDVPITLSVLSGEQLVDRGVEEIADLSKAVPSFTYAESRVGTPIYTLRGVGFNDIALGGRPTVSVYVDEVPIPFAIQTRGGFVDLERVEVLKGPQGTLFGQNATGGAINLIAAKPTDEFEGKATLGYGRFNEFLLGGVVSTPLSENSGVRLSFEHRNGSDWQEDYLTNNTVGAQSLTTLRGVFDVDFSESVSMSINLNGYIDKSESQAPQLSGIFPGIPPVAGFIPGLNVALPEEDNRIAAFTPDDYARDNQFIQGSVRFDIDLNEHFTLTSLSSLSDYDQDQTVDVDGQAIIGLQQRTLGDISSVFQELRVAGTLGESAFLTVGANYSKDETREFNIDDISQSTLGVATGLLTFDLQNDQDIETYALFGTVDYELSEGVTLQGGIRYTRSINDFEGCSLDSGDGTASGFYVNVLGLPAPGAGNCFTFDATTFSSGLVQTELDEDNVSWRVGLDWDPTEDVKVYANVSRGYKAGGFPTLAATFAPQYDPTVQEQLTSYEMGFKSSPGDNVTLNGAVYYYDYTDKQVLGFTNDPTFGPLLRLNNVPESRVLGAEIDLMWEPVEGFVVNGALSHVDSEVTSPYVSQDAFGVDRNFEGEPFPNAPKWQGSSDVSYQWAMANGFDAFVGVSGSFQSGSNSEFGQSPELDIDSYGLLDARAGFGPSDGKWKLTGWVRNLTDEYYWTFASKTNDTFIRYTGRPRTYGVTLEVGFGN